VCVCMCVCVCVCNISAYNIFLSFILHIVRCVVAFIEQIGAQ